MFYSRACNSLSTFSVHIWLTDTVLLNLIVYSMSKQICQTLINFINIQPQLCRDKTWFDQLNSESINENKRSQQHDEVKNVQKHPDMRKPFSSKLYGTNSSLEHFDLIFCDRMPKWLDFEDFLKFL